ncbi:MAG: BON domain-containing protein [Cycloclasticus sp. symbiont of Poecilosclerida sp. M]|nr:MAG: BON domain-containing protein [Cycloclasticus sp. symbiont of Poecilosclerida sp. M]
MNRTIKLILLSSLLIVFISGCAAIAVGSGAATGVAIVHDRRSAGTVIDDQGIEFKALRILYSDDAIRNNTHINVTCYNGLLLLTGEAPTEALRNKVVSKLSSLPKVKRTQNEIIVAASSSYLSRSSDSLITSKAKVSLLGLNHIQGFDPTRVKVVSENGVVYLMGLLLQHEISPVIETIRRVGGVQRVVKLFETIN